MKSKYKKVAYFLQFIATIVIVTITSLKILDFINGKETCGPSFCTEDGFICTDDIVCNKISLSFPIILLLLSLVLITINLFLFVNRRKVSNTNNSIS